MVSFLEGAIIVLQSLQAPCHYKDIYKEIVRRNLVQTSGRTPDHTLNSKLSTEARRTGACIRRVSTPGYYELSDWAQHLSHNEIMKRYNNHKTMKTVSRSISFSDLEYQYEHGLSAVRRVGIHRDPARVVPSIPISANRPSRTISKREVIVESEAPQEVDEVEPEVLEPTPVPEPEPEPPVPMPIALPLLPRKKQVGRKPKPRPILSPGQPEDTVMVPAVPVPLPQLSTIQPTHKSNHLLTPSWRLHPQNGKWTDTKVLGEFERPQWYIKEPPPDSSSRKRVSYIRVWYVLECSRMTYRDPLEKTETRKREQARVKEEIETKKRKKRLAGLDPDEISEDEEDEELKAWISTLRHVDDGQNETPRWVSRGFGNYMVAIDWGDDDFGARPMRSKSRTPTVINRRTFSHAYDNTDLPVHLSINLPDPDEPLIVTLKAPELDDVIYRRRTAASKAANEITKMTKLAYEAPKKHAKHPKPKYKVVYVPVPVLAPAPPPINPSPLKKSVKPVVYEPIPEPEIEPPSVRAHKTPPIATKHKGVTSKQMLMSSRVIDDVDDVDVDVMSNSRSQASPKPKSPSKKSKHGFQMPSFARVTRSSGLEAPVYQGFRPRL